MQSDTHRGSFKSRRARPRDERRHAQETRHADKANWMPTKRKRDLKIDGFMAWLFAHTLAMRHAEPAYDEDRFDITHISLE